VFDVCAVRPAHTIAGFDGEVAWLKTLRALKGNLDLVHRGTLLGRHSTAAQHQQQRHDNALQQRHRAEERVPRLSASLPRGYA
jgi:hypothetical protein